VAGIYPRSVVDGRLWLRVDWFAEGARADCSVETRLGRISTFGRYPVFRHPFDCAGARPL